MAKFRLLDEYQGSFTKVRDLHQIKKMLRPHKVISKKYLTTKTKILKYLEHTEFHGAKMLSTGEARWYWIPLMLVLMVCASTLFYLTIKRFQDNPTLITYKELGNVVTHFPCVLVCPELNFQDIKKEEFLSTMTYPDDLNETYIRSVLPQLGAFFSTDVFFQISDLDNLEKFLMHNNVNVETAGRRLTMTCEETLLRCRYNNVYYNCSQIFKMEVTGDGFCCVFNGRSLIGEMKEHGKRLKKHSGKSEWSAEVGFSWGLTLAIDQSQEFADVDLSYKWIALQSAQRFVDVTSNGTALSPGYEQWMIYTINHYHLTDEVKRLRSALRNCNMPDKGLKYFPVYRRRYCIIECEIAKTIKLCNCVRRVHPKPRGVSYCKARDLPCANHARVSYGSSCDCLSTCDVETETITTTGFVLDSSVVSFDPFYTGLNFEKVSVVKIFTQSRKQRSYERFSYYNYLDLFSQLGGMFNVFFGCSILTILGLLQLALRLLSNECTRYFKKETNKERTE